jgi:hypothetical protein
VLTMDHRYCSLDDDRSSSPAPVAAIPMSKSAGAMLPVAGISRGSSVGGEAPGSATVGAMTWVVSSGSVGGDSIVVTGVFGRAAGLSSVTEGTGALVCAAILAASPFGYANS